MWITSGVQTNPIIDFIFADSGAFANGGQTSVKLILSSTIGGGIVLEQRNAANNTNVNSHTFIVNANTSLCFEIPGVIYAAGERFRIRNNAALVGLVQASLVVF